MIAVGIARLQDGRVEVRGTAPIGGVEMME